MRWTCLGYTSLGLGWKNFPSFIDFCKRLILHDVHFYFKVIKAVFSLLKLYKLGLYNYCDKRLDDIT